MGSYYMEDPGLYSGYDEYAGIFGPLQVSSSSACRSRGRVPPRRRGFSEPRNLDFSSKLRNSRKNTAPRDFDRRSKYLSKRKTKRAFQLLEGDSDDIDDSQDKENEPSSPNQRQVWLPTRNFAFRQRAGKLDTRAIARLDLEKIAAMTDIETIQRHLENLAFSDVTLDDVQHYSDAYFLKLFQIAQLTMEYLMHVQDSLVDHSEGFEKQCEQLMTECQQLETENGQHETEISSLKREIRQKQRTMATLELMLLNASASNRISSSAKENAAKEANALVDDLLSNRAEPATEQGFITSPVSCVLCGKRFVSAEFLLRHQRRRHQDSKKSKKKKKKSTSSSNSSSDSDSPKKHKKKKPAPLPKEILDALEEKNQLAKQLMALQDQVRLDNEARDRQRQHLKNQQSQMTSRMEQYMERLQTTLVEIEKKQEATKQDLRQYTQESIARLQVEAANAELLRIQAQKTSRAGRLENDDGEVVKKSMSEEARWLEKVEKLMDTFLKAQAQKQQEIDVLEQESSKLWTKYNKLKKRHHRPEPTMTLADLTVLDADRFGVDRGEVVEAPRQKCAKVERPAILEDKLVQTDEESERKQSKRLPEVQAYSEPKVSVGSTIVAPPVRVETIQRIVSPPPAKQSPVPAIKNIPDTIVVAAPAEEKESKQPDSTLKFQQAAHVIGKVALGFLVRRALAKAANWRIVLEIASLEAALTAPELEYARHHYDNQVYAQVEEAMTANDLRVLIAKLLSGKDEFEDESGGGANDNDDLEVTSTMTYHRILLHHKETGAELSGDIAVHNLKHAIEVEIIPYHEVAAMQVGQVIETHAMISDRIENIKPASTRLSSSDLTTLKDENDESKNSSKSAFAGIVRLQALIRGFLAKKMVELMKIDRLVDARLVKMRSPQNPKHKGAKMLEPSWMTLDPVLSGEYEKVQQRLAQVLRVKLRKEAQQAVIGDEDICSLSSGDYEKHTTELEVEQQTLPADVQRRIQLLTERLTPMATGEYRRRESDARQATNFRNTGAAKIHRAVQVQVVRKRLKRLLADDAAQQAKHAGDIVTKSSGQSHSIATNSLLSSWLSMSKEGRQTDGKSVGNFDPNEIDQLANAYEEGDSSVKVPTLNISEVKEQEPPISRRNLEIKEDKDTEDKPQKVKEYEPPTSRRNPEIKEDKDEEDKPQIPQPLTPRAGLEGDEETKPSTRPRTPILSAKINSGLDSQPGRSPRPDPGVHVISPFSKTPLISRRAKRGTGFDNAR